MGAGAGVTAGATLLLWSMWTILVCRFVRPQIRTAFGGAVVGLVGGVLYLLCVFAPSITGARQPPGFHPSDALIVAVLSVLTVRGVTVLGERWRWWPTKAELLERRHEGAANGGQGWRGHVDPLIKLVALSVFVAALYTGFYYRFVRPHVHYIFDGFLQGMLFFLLVLTRMCAVQLGWIPASYPGDPWLASSQELLSMLVTNFLTSMVVVFIGSALKWFPESTSWTRLAERARAARQAKLAAQALRDRSIDPTR